MRAFPPSPIALVTGASEMNTVARPEPRRILSWALTLVACLASAGCAALGTDFQCTTDEQCTLKGVAGVCELDTGACSTADTECPSKRRYSPYAGSLARTCVAEPPNWDRVSDWCPLPTTNLISSNLREYSGTVLLNSLVSDVTEVPKATGLVGPDGVFGFTVAPQERVSIRYDFAPEPGQAAPPVDLAMYLMGSCNIASFIRRNDRCPAGVGEDIWWQMNDAPGTYYLGFDSRTYDQATLNPRVKLTVSFPRYGDGTIDFGEACDDSNKVSGDGCTADGLWELKNVGGQLMTEKEPNNQPLGGNVVIMNVGETATIVGSTGDTCDNDFYSIDVPQGTFPQVTMLNFNGNDCVASEVGVIAMQLNRLDGTRNVEQVKLGDGRAVDGGNACPAFTATSLGFAGSPDGGVAAGLTAGRYGVEIKGYEVGKKNVPYRLKIELVSF